MLLAGYRVLTFLILKSPDAYRTAPPPGPQFTIDWTRAASLHAALKPAVLTCSREYW